ncbi:MAG: rhamnogalacturonan acetylesterase, partial [Firmicutes bacterium]|nr:rhamnogalacturonan acetylesterase [Bacillota bacterium]
EHMSVTLRIASVGDTSAVRFFVIDEERLSAGLDTVRELKLCRLETCRLERGAVRKKPTLFIASDSTAQSYGPENYPQTGWGQMLHKYFRGADFAFEYVPKGSSYSLCRAYECPGVIIENRSIGGRSSRSFVLEGKWNELLFRCEAGDYIFIQFGHNDSTKARPNRYTSIDEFGEYIRMYVASAKARGAIPVLVTPVSRRSINEETGVFNISFPEHRNTVLKIARELDTPVIDLGLESRNICEGICETLGAEATKELFLWTYEGEYSGVYCRGSRDDTHLQRRGALIFAGAVAKLIEASDDTRLDPLKAQLDPDMKYELYLPTGEERH